MNKKVQAQEIISKWKPAAAIAAGSLASLSSTGEDVAFLTKIVGGMLQDISSLFDKEAKKQDYSKAVGIVAGVMAGSILSNILIGWVPVIGNVVNAGVTSAATEKIGWAAFKALEDGRSISDLTSSDWKRYIKAAERA